MRCIEILRLFQLALVPVAINRNMRCIEISQTSGRLRLLQLINRNMRCIEILLLVSPCFLPKRLIET